MAKPRRSRRPRTTLLILLAISVAIITLDLRGGLSHVTSGAQSVASDAFSPVRSGVDDIVRPVGNFLAGSVHYGSVKEQNQKLQQQLNQLKAQRDQQSTAEQQLKQLHALLDLPLLANLQSRPAQVINYNSSDFAATIDIDKGRSDGVTVGMPVVAAQHGTAGGLVGQVIAASHHTAVVRLLTDGNSVVGATYGATTTDPTASMSIVDGVGWGKPLSGRLIPAGTPLTRGELFTTSGLQGAAYPMGIPVARVTSFRSGNTASLETVNLAPVVDLAHLQYVSVILWGPS